MEQEKKRFSIVKPKLGNLFFIQPVHPPGNFLSQVVQQDRAVFFAQADVVKDVVEIRKFDLETGFEMFHQFEQARPSLVDDPAGLQGIDQFDQACAASALSNESLIRWGAYFRPITMMGEP